MRSPWDRMVVVLAVAFASSCVALASAQRIGDNPERSRPGRIVDAAAISVQGFALHDPLWTLDPPPSVGRLDADVVAVGDGAVFFGDTAPKGTPLFALDALSGKRRWTSAFHASSLTYANNLIFAVTTDAQKTADVRVIALDSHTGRLRWSTPGLSVAIERQLAIVANGLHLEARDAMSGKLMWSAAWNGYPTRDARLVGTTLLLHTWESGAISLGVWYGIDARDGHALWTFNSNAILGVLPDGDVALDATWGPTASFNYTPLTETIISPAGAVRSLHTYSPDRERWAQQVERDVRNAQDALIDGDALLFRIGANTVYRYPLGADPTLVSGTRYELGSLSQLTPGTWLVHMSDDSATLAQFASNHVTLHHITGLGTVAFTGSYAGLAFIATRDRAIVFDPARPADTTLTRFPCSAVTRAFIADGKLVAVCSAPTLRLVALPFPRTYTALSLGTPVPVHMQPLSTFSVTIHAYAVPTSSVSTHGAAFASDGTLWFCEHAFFSQGINGHTDFIGHLKSDGTIEEFPVPSFGANAGSIVRAPDGAMWFTEASTVKIGRIDAKGTIIEYPLPSELDRSPTFGPLTRRLLPANPLKVPEASRAPAYVPEKLGGMVVGPDGALWFTSLYGNAIARMTASGSVRVFPLPETLLNPGPITRGPDGALWFGAHNAIGRLTVNGIASPFPVSTALPLTSITWGPDGNVWFSFFDGRVGRMTARGVTNIFTAPIVAAPNGPLIGGCDGTLYLADRSRPALWRITTAGHFEQHDIPYTIGHMARASNCTLGFTEAQMPATTHVGTISF